MVIPDPGSYIPVLDEPNIKVGVTGACKLNIDSCSLICVLFTVRGVICHITELNSETFPL